jgi:hypothetical protein
MSLSCNLLSFFSTEADHLTGLILVITGSRRDCAQAPRQKKNRKKTEKKLLAIS